jgi:hypothetical protein
MWARRVHERQEEVFGFLRTTEGVLRYLRYEFLNPKRIPGDLILLGNDCREIS